MSPTPSIGSGMFALSAECMRLAIDRLRDNIKPVEIFIADLPSNEKINIKISQPTKLLKPLSKNCYCIQVSSRSIKH